MVSLLFGCAEALKLLAQAPIPLALDALIPFMDGLVVEIALPAELAFHRSSMFSSAAF
jgi:hypothetical protein